MNADLERALEQADLRAIIADLYPDAEVHPGLSKQRIPAVWRGGGNPDVVSLTTHTAHDFKTGETWNVWTFLTEVAGYSKQDAANYLLARAGLGDGPHDRRQAARRVTSDNRQNKQREAYLQRKLEQATEHQSTGSIIGSSGYLERKQVTNIFKTHQVAEATDPTGAELPGVTFGKDDRGTFVQFALRNVSGELSGYQRIYDTKVLPGERDKDFIGATKGAFVLLLPKGVKLPRTNLAGLIANGYEIGACEGVATGASVCLAKPKTIMLCALYAGNLRHILAAFRKQYGTTRKDPDGGRRAITITIWADNDAWGNFNTGLTKAHSAALEHLCYVRAPSFKGRKLDGAKPTDFNDLHTLFGLEAVRRSRKVEPDTQLAFHKELGKQKLSINKHLAPFELPGPKGALLVRAPMETGKTHQLERTLSNARTAKLRVLVVVHRESLADSLAARLGLENYNDYNAAELRHINRGLVICFDSLHKLAIGGELPYYDVLVLDECEQVLRHTKEPHIKNKQTSFDTLTHYLHHAPRFIGLDAHAGAITTYALARFAPDKQVSWHRHDHHIGAGRRARLVFDRHETIDALEQSNGPTWYTSDSLKHTRDLDAYFDDPKTLTINSETTSTEPVKSYLNDPSRSAPNHTRLIASPSVQTGVSDDSGHWRHVIGAYSGAIGIAQDHVQSLLRARGVEQLTVWINHAKRAPKTQADSLREIEAADKAEAERAGREAHAARNPEYLALKTFVLGRESKARANPKRNVARELTLLGYDVTCELPQNLSKDDLAKIGERGKAIRDAGMARYVRDRVRATQIDWQRAKELEDKHRKTQAELFALEQFKVRDFYRLPDDVPDETLSEMLERDNYGKLRTQVTNYEHFMEPQGLAAHLSESQLETAPLLGDGRHHLLIQDFYKRLGEVVGLTTETETSADAWHADVSALESEIAALQAERADASTICRGVIDKQVKKLERELATLNQATLEMRYSADSMKPFAKWCAVNRDALTEALGEMPTKEQLKNGRIISHVATWLKGAGLEQQSEKTKDGRSYAVTLSSIHTMRGLSCPRRDKWDLWHYPVKEPLIEIVPQTLEIPSETGETSPLPEPKPDGEALGWLNTFTSWLEAGKLDDFGEQNLQTIRKKLEVNDRTWLYRLAASREVYQMVGRM